MLYAILAIILILLDQISKHIIVINLYNSSISLIPNILNFTYVENTGALFGIGKESLILFIISNIFIIAFLIYYLIKNKYRLVKIEKISGILIISGGIGNLIDRAFKGFVVDFIDINPIFSFPMFNLADMLVVVGCGLFILAILLQNKHI